MKRNVLTVSLIAAILAVSAPLVLAAVTPSRDDATVAAGAATYSNTKAAVVRQLKRVDITGIQPATFTASVSVVSGSFTTTVQSVVGASGVGGINVTGTVYLWSGDSLVASGVGTNAGTVRYTFDELP